MWIKTMNKEQIRKRINEARDVSVYKKLLNVLSCWSNKFPLTGIDSYLDKAVENGKSILPKDKRALAILDHLLSSDSFAEAVSNLLNMRFADLPTDLKPLAKIDKKCQLAFWNAGGIVTDRVKSLINFDKGEAGFFCDIDGVRVTLLDTEDEENKENNNE